MTNNSLSPCDTAGAERAADEKAENLFERSEFFSARPAVTQRREPAAGGQGAGRVFLLPLLTRIKRGSRRAGTKPRGFFKC